MINQKETSMTHHFSNLRNKLQRQQKQKNYNNQHKNRTNYQFKNKLQSLSANHRTKLIKMILNQKPKQQLQLRQKQQIKQLLRILQMLCKSLMHKQFNSKLQANLASSKRLSLKLISNRHWIKDLLQNRQKDMHQKNSIKVKYSKQLSLMPISKLLQQKTK